MTRGYYDRVSKVNGHQLRYCPHISSEEPEPEVASSNGQDTRKARATREVNRLQRVQRKFKIAMLSAVTIGEIQEIMSELVRQAKKGNISAAREVLDRCVGKTSEQEVIERLAELEALVLSSQGEALGEESVRSNAG